MKFTKFLITLPILALFGCATDSTDMGNLPRMTVLEDLNLMQSNNAQVVAQAEPVTIADRKIVMQRVKDSRNLPPQHLVNRDAMQLALMQKMNDREEKMHETLQKEQSKQRKLFLKESKKQKDMFLKAHQENMLEMKTTSRDMQLASKEIGLSTDRLSKLSDRFIMIADDQVQTNLLQKEYFNDMRKAYEEDLAYKRSLIQKEKEKENSIRGVVENMYEDQDLALKKFYESNKDGMLPPSQWVDLENAKFSIHVENEKFENLMTRAVNKAAINSGPWALKWKLKKENEILLFTKFSIDAETDFGNFISRVKAYIRNYNGVRLYFRVFKEKRILIVSDT